MPIPPIIQGLTTAAADYITEERKRQREAEDKEIEYQQKLLEMQMSRPDFNPAHMSRALEDLIALSQGKGARKPKGGKAGFMGATDTPVSQLIQGLSRGDIPVEGSGVSPETQQVPAPPQGAPAPQGMPPMGPGMDPGMGAAPPELGVPPPPVAAPMVPPPAPLFFDANTMAQRAGAAEGIKTDAVSSAKRNADIKALRSLNMPEDQIQAVMQRQVAGGNLPTDQVSGTPQKYTWKDEAGETRQGWAIVKNGKMVDATTDLPLPPNADFYEPEKNVSLDAAISAAIRSGNTEEAARLIKAYREMHPGAANRGITPTAEASMISRLQTQWDKNTAAMREVDRQLSIMRSSLTNYKTDPVGASQAIITTFNKILDPTSVVRESEYARLGENLSYLDGLFGRWEKFVVGGAGVPLDTLKGILDTAAKISTGVKRGAEGLRTRTKKTADRFSIPEELVFTDNLGVKQGADPQDVKDFMKDFGVDEATARRMLEMAQ